MRFWISLLLATLLLAGTPALADDWTVVKLRGTAQIWGTGEAWAPLKRGDIVPDSTTVRTLEDGYVDLQRGKEVIKLGINTQVRISDKPGESYTIVHQDQGRVEVEADVRNVKHFEVDTNFLAAVVKGTHFVITASPVGGKVTVARGSVEVTSVASKRVTHVDAGQAATVTSRADIVFVSDGPRAAIMSPDGTVFQPASGGTDASGAVIPVIDATGDSATGAPGDPAAIQVADAGGLSLRGGLTASGSGTAFGLSPAPAATQDEPINGLTVAIGLLVGVVIGAFALLLRRTV